MERREGEGGTQEDLQASVLGDRLALLSPIHGEKRVSLGGERVYKRGSPP